MEKRFTLALVLSLLVLFLYQTYVLQPKQQAHRKKLEQERLELEEKKKAEEAANPKPSSGGGGTDPEAGARPGSANKGRAELEQEARTVVLENERLRLEFSSLGGVLKEARLKDFRPTAASNKDDHLRLLVPSSVGLESMRLDDASVPGLRLGSSLWTMTEGADKRSVTLTRPVTWTAIDGTTVGYTFTKIFRLAEGARNDIEVEFRFKYEKGAGDERSQSFNLLLTGGVFQEFGGDILNGPRSAYYPFDEDVEIHAASSVAGEMDDGEDVLDIFEKGVNPPRQKSLDFGSQFVADLSTYHGAFLLLKEFPGVTVSVNVTARKLKHFDDRHDEGGREARTCTVVSFTADRARLNQEIVWKGILYLGPIDNIEIASRLGSILSEGDIETLGEVYEDQLGWARFIGRVILAILRFMHGITNNWGWAIVLLTLCVRVVLFPVNRKSQTAMLVHSEKMAKLKPKLDALKKKYEDDKRKFAEEQMKLMREHGVGLPLGGCLPIFLQIPIFFGLFSALRASIELRQAPWLWVPDLSQPDHLITFDSPIPIRRW